MDNIDVLDTLASLFVPHKFVKSEHIQSLWSGYGEIARYKVTGATDANTLIPNQQQKEGDGKAVLHGNSLIIKLVQPSEVSQHPRGWGTQVAHQRKLDSYKNEALFYQYYSVKTDEYCRVPHCFKTVSENKSKVDPFGHYDQNSLLVMEDLDSAGFTYRCNNASFKIISLGLRWIAHFHARFLHEKLDKLWSVGTYWHLATRPDELNKMEEGRLKNAASALDKTLNNSRFQTLLHGDAKLANFCFTANQDDISAVDFQYVGRGCGMKDLMYFLGSCLNQKDLKNNADNFLDDYFRELQKAIQHYKINVDFTELESEWRYLYPLAWADFERFLTGWASEHTKINRYMKVQTDIALARLDAH